MSAGTALRIRRHLDIVAIPSSPDLSWPRGAVIGRNHRPCIRADLLRSHPGLIETRTDPESGDADLEPGGDVVDVDTADREEGDVGRQHRPNSLDAGGAENLGVRPAFLPAAQFSELISKEDAALSRLMQLIGLKKTQ